MQSINVFFFCILFSVFKTLNIYTGLNRDIQELHQHLATAADDSILDLTLDLF